jgi:NAD(P)-dependent dehydrogenase (short-subunit alcohol dehydrogenase family)
MTTRSKTGDARPAVPQELAGRVAVITGGGNGIGRGIALELASRGADIVIADLDEVGGRKVAGEVEALGRKAIFVRTDVTSQTATDAMAKAALDRFGRIDILVNNAGVGAAPGWARRRESTNDDWDAVFNVNVFGIVHATKSVEPHMQERRAGKIVNIASIAGRSGGSDLPHYAASKAAAINVTQAYALRLAKSNINVNAIAPGLVWTALTDQLMGKLKMSNPDAASLSNREFFLKRAAEQYPLGREITPEDIGKACAFLVSDRARNITGQTINVSAGRPMN